EVRILRLDAPLDDEVRLHPDGVLNAYLPAARACRRYDVPQGLIPKRRVERATVNPRNQIAQFFQRGDAHGYLDSRAWFAHQIIIPVERPRLVKIVEVPNRSSIPR